MSSDDLTCIGVAGAGTMGRGIASTTLLAGFDVVLYDLERDLLEQSVRVVRKAIDTAVSKGKLAQEAADSAITRIRAAEELDGLSGCDLVVEAIIEDLQAKCALFSKLDALVPGETILATNTSSLSVNALAGALERPDRFIGLHFFNPAHIMPLVEVIASDDTSDHTVERADRYVKQLGKSAVHCKDTPGFIVNRVARPFYGEAFRMLGENAAGVETIDRLMKSIGFAMGPFELIDLVGCDVNLAVTESVFAAYYQDSKYRPHPIQRKMVESGRLGRKSGRGFYDYRKEAS